MRYLAIVLGISLAACGTRSSSGAGGYVPLACGVGGTCPSGMTCVNGICAQQYDIGQDTAGGSDTGGAGDAGGGIDAGGSSSGGAVDAGGSGSGGHVDADGSGSGGPVDAGGSASGGGTAGCAGVAGVCYEAIVIYDGSKVAPTKCVGTGPGADIDFVSVWRKGKVVAVGKMGTVGYAKSTAAGCKDNNHAQPDDVAAIAGGFGDICQAGGKLLPVKSCKQADLSGGYLSLGGGSVELQLAACESSGGTDQGVAHCSGLGPAFGLLPGDEIDVYELGQGYKQNYGFTCKCDDEGFEVDVRRIAGVQLGAISLGASAGGSKTFKVPE